MWKYNQLWQISNWQKLTQGKGNLEWRLWTILLIGVTLSIVLTIICWYFKKSGILFLFLKFTTSNFKVNIIAINCKSVQICLYTNQTFWGLKMIAFDRCTQTKSCQVSSFTNWMQAVCNTLDNSLDLTPLMTQNDFKSFHHWHHLHSNTPCSPIIAPCMYTKGNKTTNSFSFLAEQQVKSVMSHPMEQDCLSWLVWACHQQFDFPPPPLFTFLTPSLETTLHMIDSSGISGWQVHWS